MNQSQLFFYIFTATILAIRLSLYVWPLPGPTIYGYRIHHYHIGALIAAFGLIFDSLPAYAVGLALTVDELTYLLIGGQTHEDNYSLPSLVGTSLLIALVFLCRDLLVRPVS